MGKMPMKALQRAKETASLGKRHCCLSGTAARRKPEDWGVLGRESTQTEVSSWQLWTGCCCRRTARCFTKVTNTSVCRHSARQHAGLTSLLGRYRAPRYERMHWKQEGSIPSCRTNVLLAFGTVEQNKCTELWLYNVSRAGFCIEVRFFFLINIIKRVLHPWNLNTSWCTSSLQHQPQGGYTEFAELQRFRPLLLGGLC